MLPPTKVQETPTPSESSERTKIHMTSTQHIQDTTKTLRQNKGPMPGSHPTPPQKMRRKPSSSHRVHVHLQDAWLPTHTTCHSALRRTSHMQCSAMFPPPNAPAALHTTQGSRTLTPSLPREASPRHVIRDHSFDDLRHPSWSRPPAFGQKTTPRTSYARHFGLPTVT